MALVLDMSNCNTGSIAGRDFTFAFNDSKFSDRILRIEIKPDGCDYNMADSMTNGKPEKENADTNESSCSIWKDCFNIAVRVRNIHVSSAILAEMSPFFHKLFSNGMRGSEEPNITMRISCSEEVAFMDLLQFMYSGKLAACSTTKLLDLLIIADKFLVTTCVHYCSIALQNSSMSVEDALIYLELPSCIQTNDSVRQLIESLKKFLTQEFIDIEKFAEGLLRLPLAGIEVVLSSDGLIVESEDAVYDFVIKWARKHYPGVEKRREILVSKLCPLIRFPNMSTQKLKDVLSCNDSDNVCVSKAVLEALLLKADAPDERLNERVYKLLPLAVMELEAPVRQCRVYWNITEEDFQRLLFQKETSLYSQYFQFISTKFQLSATNVSSHVSVTGQCEFDVSIWPNRDDERQLNPLQSAVIAYEFAVLRQPEFEFESIIQSEIELSSEKMRYVNWQYSPGYYNKDIRYINNIIQFRLQLALIPEPSGR